MRAVVLALVVAALVAGQASADAAVGVKDARLTGIATALVGKPTTVRCASDKDVQKLTRASYPTSGATVVASRTIYLTTETCDVLYFVDGNPRTLATWGGASLETFVHETWHARGILDESDAECRAMREIGQVAIQRFHVTNRKWLHDAVADAWINHQSLMSVYTRLC